MRVGVLAAMHEEIDRLEAELEGESVRSIGGRRYLSGRLWGTEAVLCFSRWGKVAAASTVTTLLDVFSIDALLFVGVAGAAAPDLDIGDVVVATELLQHDLDARPLFPRFEVPLLGVARLAGDERLTGIVSWAAARFVASGSAARKPRVRTGVVASGDQFISDAAVLASLRSAIPGLQCVEMEGAAVAQVCFERRTPFAIVRVISDRADHQAPTDFAQFLAVASAYATGILRETFADLCRLPP